MALVIQHAMRMRRIILSSVPSLTVQSVSTLSRKQRDFRGEKVIGSEMCVLIFSTNFV